ncbi:glycoside hydrolase [Xylanimonas oleitrophica]|uniref:Glycoside hydrolase n=1 Tax=Xylanimonas oleitrophica TaxID=2607479 RepID=A0A2W5WP46_9MICO|nr:C40 family peptidase [Xylanimonas oleitrophica]PZR52930.1 glycoside hydrolase [Xylanimonas oleitrophica]
MSARTTRARHRAAHMPITPLTGITKAVTANAGRRAAVVAAAGGILVSTLAGATSAQAQPLGAEQAKSAGADLGKLSEQARQALQAAPAVTVAPDAQVSVENISAEGIASIEVTPAPKPEPKPEPKPKATETRSAQTASRSAERAEAPAAEAPAAEAPAEEAAAPVAVAASGVGATVAEIAQRYVGVPYVVGGASPSGFDCSGLVSYVYRQVGIELPHQSTAIRDSGRTSVISASEAQPGDLIWSPGHISIYIGNGLQVDASRPDGWNVNIRKIWQSNPTYLRVS